MFLTETPAAVTSLTGVTVQNPPNELADNVLQGGNRAVAPPP